MKKTLTEILSTARNSPTYKREKIVLTLTEEIIAHMDEQNINKAQLAKKMGKSKPYITKILSGEANFTIDSMIHIADALATELSVHLTSRHCETQWIDIRRQTSSTIKKNSAPTWQDWQADEFLEKPQLLAAL